MRIFSMIFLLTFFPLAPAWSDSTEDEEAVWALEEAYWTYVKNNDIASYLTLWDENFVGWPSFSRTALEKVGISDWIAPLHENPSEEYDYKLTREAVRSFGNVVVVHYLFHESFRSKETGKLLRSDAPGRITHTWQRHGDTWQIITGMSAAWIDQQGE